MLLRSRLSLLLVLGAALSLASCSQADWRLGVEKPEDCVVRLNKGAEEIHSQPAAQHFRWVPTFTFDVTKMGQAALDELVAATGARVLDDSVGAPPAAEATISALLYAEGGASFLRLRDRPVAVPNAAAAGCALQRPDMRLVGMLLEPPPK